MIDEQGLLMDEGSGAGATSCPLPHKSYILVRQSPIIFLPPSLNPPTSVEAMILAAGLGTRLRPLTHETPKALVEVGGVPMLERVARRLVAAGADRLVINISPHPDKIRRFIDTRDGFGAEIHISEEPDGPLETGGGLKKAAPLFRRDGPFLMHNVDIMTGIDLEALFQAHEANDALATLAVRAPETERYLIFDDAGLLGYAYQGEEKLVREAEGALQRFDFCGVQILSPRIFELMEEEGKFSIINTYMRLVRTGERIAAFDVGDALWLDIGTHERLEQANALVD